MKESSALRFVPGHIAPEDAGPSPRLFAFHRRELLVTEANTLPSVETIDGLGIEAARTQYLGAWDGEHCFSAELPADFKLPDGYATRDLRMLFGEVCRIESESGRCRPGTFPGDVSSTVQGCFVPVGLGIGTPFRGSRSGLHGKGRPGSGYFRK